MFIKGLQLFAEAFKFLNLIRSFCNLLLIQIEELLLDTETAGSGFSAQPPLGGEGHDDPNN